jgi:hypothetical protein
MRSQLHSWRGIEMNTGLMVGKHEAESLLGTPKFRCNNNNNNKQKFVEMASYRLYLWLERVRINLSGILLGMESNLCKTKKVLTPKHCQ